MTSMLTVGQTWTWVYDRAGRVVGAGDPDTGTTTTSYLATGEPVTVTDARGVPVTTSYDAAGRKTSQTANATQTATWTYQRRTGQEATRDGSRIAIFMAKVEWGTRAFEVRFLQKIRILARAGKFAGIAGALLSAVNGAAQQYEDDSGKRTKQRYFNAAARGSGRLFGSLAGAAVGEAVGTAVGRLCGPGAVLCSPPLAAAVAAGGGAVGASGGNVVANNVIRYSENRGSRLYDWLNS